jgi:hypothetical protein
VLHYLQICLREANLLLGASRNEVAIPVPPGQLHKAAAVGSPRIICKARLTTDKHTLQCSYD